MSRVATKVLKTALSALHYSGLGTLGAPLARGRGVIFTLHQVEAARGRTFDPNGILRVTPEFLDQVLQQVRDSGFDLISLDEAHERLTSRQRAEAPFACFTFDDGYRDNLEVAYPILKRHKVPFAVYVTTDFSDGKGELWWLVLEQVIAKSRVVTVQMDGALRTFDCSSDARRAVAFDTIYWWMRGLPEIRMRQVVRELAAGAGVDSAGICRDLIMTWDEIRTLASDPLVTIGAHSCRHYALAKLPAAEARSEIADSIARISAELGRPCRHFSYPYGDETSATPREFAFAAEMGAKTAVTTRKALIQGTDRDDLFGLPRVSLNGEYQHRRYVDVLLTGTPFMFLNMFRRESLPTA